jgi:hypothetical protein
MTTARATSDLSAPAQLGGRYQHWKIRFLLEGNSLFYSLLQEQRKKLSGYATGILPDDEVGSLATTGSDVHAAPGRKFSHLSEKGNWPLK